METEAAHAHAEIEKARQQVAASVVALRGELASTTDWRQWVRRRPLALIAGAFVVGFLFGSRRR